MNAQDISPAGRARSPKEFDTTSWSLVLQAARPTEREYLKAMDKLCQLSWYPIYAFVRRLGYNQADAEDLAQGFFEHLLQNNVIAQADKNRGRFRSFLLGSLRNYVNNVERKARTQKRGGKVVFVPMDAMEGESRFQQEIPHSESPEKQFDRSWANQLIQRTAEALRADYERANKLALYEALSPFLVINTTNPSYEELAKKLNMSVGTVAVAVFRMRKRYGELLRKQITMTVENPADVEHEIRLLLDTLAS